jgi:hypothetical protein
VYGAFDAAELRSARNDGGGWVFDVLGTTDVWGNEPAVTTDAEGTAHVCFRDSVDQSLRYGQNAGAGWTSCSMN